MLDISLDEKASAKYNCLQCPRSLQRLRNCENRYEPANLLINGTKYSQCPISIYLGNIYLKQLVDMFLHSRSSKQRFIDIPVADQTNWYYEFSRFIESKIRKSEQDALENTRKDAKKTQKKNQTKRNK